MHFCLTFLFHPIIILYPHILFPNSKLHIQNIIITFFAVSEESLFPSFPQKYFCSFISALTELEFQWEFNRPSHFLGKHHHSYIANLKMAAASHKRKWILQRIRNFPVLTLNLASNFAHLESQTSATFLHQWISVGILETPYTWTEIL